MSMTLSVALYFLSLTTFGVFGTPNDGPQYYTDSVVVSDGTTYTELVVAASTPYFVSTTQTESTEAFLSTSATTIYDTFTSYETFESASTTTWYPTCSGTITVTTTTMIPYASFKVVGTSFISEEIFQTYWISGTSTSTDLATITTTFYVPGPPDIQVTTAPTDLHTAPFDFIFPCETTTITQTLSYEPAIVTEVQLRETVATTFSSSESYYTVTSTSFSTETFVSTVLYPYPKTESTESAGANTTVIEIVIFPKTHTSYITSYSTITSATTWTYHITASDNFTTTILLGAAETGGTTLSTSVLPVNGTIPVATVTQTAPSQTSNLPSATGDADHLTMPARISAVLVFATIATILLL